MPLTTVQKVKEYLQINQTDTKHDSFIQDLVDSVQDEIEKYCNRKFDVATYTEQHICKHKLFPKHTPLKSIGSITRDNSPLSSEEYRVRNNYIEFSDFRGMTMGGNIVYSNDILGEVEITYTAGYDVIPKDLQLAATKLVVLEYKDSREKRIGIEQESEGDASFVYEKKDSQMPLKIACVFNRYKKVAI